MWCCEFKKPMRHFPKGKESKRKAPEGDCQEPPTDKRCSVGDEVVMVKKTHSICKYTMKNLVPGALVSVCNVKCLIQCCAKRDWTDRSKQQKQ